MWRRGAGVDAARVRAAIEEAEHGTSAEIVVSIAPFFFGDVGAAARRAFERMGVANTRARNGVLVFVVPRRRQVVVLPDAEAEASLGEGAAAEIVDRVCAGFARGDATGGLADAVGRLGELLAVPFPWQSGDVDELPDDPEIAEP